MATAGGPYRDNADIVERQIPGAPKVVKAAAALGGDAVDWLKNKLGSTSAKTVMDDYGTWGGLGRAVNRDANAIRRVAGVPERTSESLAGAVQGGLRRQFPGKAATPKALDFTTPQPVGPGTAPQAAAAVTPPSGKLAVAPRTAAPPFDPTIAQRYNASGPNAIDRIFNQLFPGAAPTTPGALPTTTPGSFQRPAGEADNFGQLRADQLRPGNMVQFQSGKDLQAAEAEMALNPALNPAVGDRGRFSTPRSERITGAMDTANLQGELRNLQYLPGGPEQYLDASGKVTKEGIAAAKEYAAEEKAGATEKERALDLQRDAGAGHWEPIGRRTSKWASDAGGRAALRSAYDAPEIAAKDRAAKSVDQKQKLQSDLALSILDNEAKADEAKANRDFELEAQYRDLAQKDRARLTTERGQDKQVEAAVAGKQAGGTPAEQKTDALQKEWLKGAMNWDYVTNPEGPPNFQTLLSQLEGKAPAEDPAARRARLGL